jgi:hypothetical protein
MKQTIFFIIFNIPLLFFGQTQNNQCKIPINDFDLGINVNAFFVEKIISEDANLYSTENGKTINSVKAFEKFKQTQKASISNLTEMDLEKKVYFEGDEKINIAQLYSINRYTEDDKLVCYHNIWFPTFKILATNDDKFIALIAENRKVVDDNFKTLIKKIEKTNKLNITKSEKFETYSFDFETHFLKFKIAKSSYRNESNIQMPGESKDKVEKTIDLEFIILSKLASDKHLNWLNKNYEK